MIVMLYKIDGSEELIKVAQYSNCLFVQISYLIFTWVIVKFLAAYGSSIRQNYSDKLNSIGVQSPEGMKLAQ